MKVLKLVIFVGLFGLAACNEKSSVPASTCYDSGFDVQTINFDSADDANSDSFVLSIDMQSGDARLERAVGQDTDICTLSLSNGEIQSLTAGLEGPWKVCQAAANTQASVQRVLALRGSDQSEAESIAQPDNNVFQIPQGYDNLEGQILNLADKIKNQGSCISDQSSQQGGEQTDEFDVPELPGLPTL